MDEPTEAPSTESTVMDRVFSGGHRATEGVVDTPTPETPEVEAAPASDPASAETTPEPEVKAEPEKVMPLNWKYSAL